MRKRDQDQLFNQCVAQCLYGMVDENAAVVKRHDADACGKSRLNLGNLLFDGANNFARIRAVADDDHAANCFLAILVEHAAAELGTELDAGHVAQSDRRSVEGAKRNLFDVFQSADEADAAHNLLGVAGFHHFCAHVVVASFHG